MLVDKDLKDVLASCYKSLATFCRTLFPEVFSIEFSPVHIEIIRMLEQNKSKKRLILAPRGIGKTSLVCAWIAKKILFREAHVVLYVSNSEHVAIMQTENLKFLLQTPIVKTLFGDVRVTGEDSDDTFSRKSWVAFGETIVIPRGCMQQIRGIKWMQYRPDVIVFDDIEDKMELLTETNREKIRRWFYSDPLYSETTEGADFVYIDTLKHEDALPMYLIRSGWEHAILRLCDDEFKSLAPQFKTDEDIQRERAEAAASGALEEWYMERMNRPVADETRRFKSSYFKYYDESELDGKFELETVFLIDPAKTAKITSDYSAILVVTIDRINRAFYIRKCVQGHFFPEELYQTVVELAERFKPNLIGVEATGLNEYVLYPFRNAMLEAGVMAEIVPLQAGIKKKEDRIGALLPFYRQGLVYHNKEDCYALEQQLLSYPRSRYDDLMDALAYLPYVLTEGERFFLPEPVKHQVRLRQLTPSWEVI